MVLYRKYRPQNLSELDLIEVREKLTKTLTSDYKPHAYLFAGPKGTGKTSAARIVAKILNCPDAASLKSGKENIEPCNKCDSCISITEGRHLDVLEIDAASNRGIDEIRDLKEKIRLAPSYAKFKVYIIDEVHMLTTDAFNALLKTLEEPPLHSIFILATTEPDKLPETILSRSTKFNFGKATIAELTHALGRVIKGDKIKIEDEAIKLIAGYSDGSFRDATKILEQAINQKAFTEAEIAELIGVDHIIPAKFLLKLKNNKTQELLEDIVSMAEKGADFRFFTSEILNLLHRLLLQMHEIDQPGLADEVIDKFSKNDLIELIKLFSGVYRELKFASRPELPLEIAVVEWNDRKEVNNV